MIRRHDVRHLLEAWALWVERDGNVHSAIGYPPETVESRMLRFGALGGGIFGPKTPVWFSGVTEYRVHRAVMALGAPERRAVALRYLWTCIPLRKGKRPVTEALRASRWSSEGFGAPRSYARALQRGENRVAEDFEKNYR